MHNCSFSVSIRRDVFNYLFNGRGESVFRRPGRNFSRDDFCNTYFSDDNFVYCYAHGESVYVVFPLYIYSHVKFVKLSSTKDFCETVYIKLFKKR